MADERDPKVSRRYGELGAEEPPRALDQSILAAARRAVDQPHAPLVAPAGRHRWYFPLAAAAILVLAVAVTVQVERQQPDPEAVQTAPPAAPAAPMPVQEAAPKPPPKPVARPKAESPRVFAPDPVPRAKVEERVPAPPPAAVLERRESAGAAADAAASRAAAPSAPAAAKPAAAPMRSAPAQAARMAETPERELERIAELRRQERHAEADKALAEFRKRYPDYRISDAMLEKIGKK